MRAGPVRAPEGGGAQATASELLAPPARDPRRDILAPIPHARRTTLLGQILLAASHNAYHLGQLAQLERTLTRR
jgi:hypothetical protein